MIRNNRGLWLSAAATIAFALGCGEMSGTDAGNTCSTDATCGSGKACHPVLKTCVKTCTGGSDCPSNEKTCAKINSSTASFCTCSTDALCGTGNVCSAATFQCAAKCTATSCPSGFTCNATSGNCVGSAADGGSDAGMDGGTTLDAGVACSTANNQPDTCGYPNGCFGTMTCDSLADMRCPNISAAITAGRFTAWSTTSTGSIIYANTELTGETAGCSGATDVPFTTTLYAYAGPNFTFPANITAWPGFKYFTSTGTAVDIPGNLVGNVTFSYAGFVVSNAGKNAAITLTLCAPQGTTALTAGFAFTGGKAYCADLTR